MEPGNIKQTNKKKNQTTSEVTKAPSRTSSVCETGTASNDAAVQSACANGTCPSINEKYVSLQLATVEKPALYNPGDLKVANGDWVVAETLRGLELGQVIMHPNCPCSISYKVFPILRFATDDDFIKHRNNEMQAKLAIPMIRERVAAHSLPMKVLGAFITLDKNRIVIEFAAETRVDFRLLVRDLASKLRKRIELHQISIRDRSILTGGLGICGREICCASWIKDFASVSIKMAKVQGLSLNPSKISGSCGRLMCCLKYEVEAYRDFQAQLPHIGDWVKYEDSFLEVIEVNMSRNTVSLKKLDGMLAELPADEVRSLEVKVNPNSQRENDYEEFSAPSSSFESFIEATDLTIVDSFERDSQTGRLSAATNARIAPHQKKHSALEGKATDKEVDKADGKSK